MLSHPLWSSPVPHALGTEPQDIPTLTAYLPPSDKRNGASMLVLPGGGYGGLAPHEGQGYAEWFAAHGITAYVLQDRLGSHGYRHPVMLNDAARALRTVRAWARRDGLDPARIGIIGSSAGGHLASTLLTHFDAGINTASDVIERESSRPRHSLLPRDFPRRVHPRRLQEKPPRRKPARRPRPSPLQRTSSHSHDPAHVHLAHRRRPSRARGKRAPLRVGPAPFRCSV